MGIDFKIKEKTIIDVFGNLKKLKGKPVVKVGFPEGSFGSYDDEDTGKKGPSVADVALWNEYGTQDIPERPFMRNTFTKKKANIQALQKTGAKNAMLGKVKAEVTLDAIGNKVASWMKNEIGSGNFAPNKPVTIKRKGKGKKPLIDTTLMHDSVTWKVEKLK